MLTILTLKDAQSKADQFLAKHESAMILKRMVPADHDVFVVEADPENRMPARLLHIDGKTPYHLSLDEVSLSDIHFRILSDITQVYFSHKKSDSGVAKCKFLFAVSEATTCAVATASQGYILNSQNDYISFGSNFNFDIVVKEARGSNSILVAVMENYQADVIEREIIFFKGE